MTPEMISEVREAIWDALKEQTKWGWIDSECGLIDIGYADNLNMDKVAQAAINAMTGWIPE